LPTKLAPEPWRLIFAWAGIAVMDITVASEITNALARLEILIFFLSDVRLLEKNTR
jgi:hypothetical protein